MTDEWLSTCSVDKTVKLWDINTLNCAFTLTGHTQPVLWCDVSTEARLGVISFEMNGLELIVSISDQYCLVDWPSPHPLINLSGSGMFEQEIV